MKEDEKKEENEEVQNVGLIFRTLQAHIETDCFNFARIKLIYYTQPVHDH